LEIPRQILAVIPDKIRISIDSDLSLEGNGQRWGKWQVHCLEEEKKDVMNTVDSIL
jgi:hypothetical protein